MNNMSSENKFSDGDERPAAAPREVGGVLTEVIDDLKWSYAQMLEWHWGQPEELHHLAARYEEVLIRYNDYPDFYSDGTPIGAKHLDLEYEWIGYKAMEPPHRRGAAEDCRCTGLQSRQAARRCLDEHDSDPDDSDVVW